MHILLIGKSGQIGHELIGSLKNLGRLTVWGRNELDLSRPAGIVDRVVALRPDLIVNAAAYTAVDKAESEQDLAHTVNATAPGQLASAATQCGAGLIHYSTDYVFDGKKNQPYTEKDTPCPVNAYGLSKLEGERAVSLNAEGHLILRVCGVYGLRGKNFLLTMLELARQKKSLRIVNDQWGAPTWSREIANATADIIRTLSADAPDDFLTNMQKLSGVYHLSCAGKTNWFEFADTIFSLSGLNPERCPIPSAEYPTPAERPKYWILSNEKIQRTFSVKLADWKDTLTACLNEQRQIENLPLISESPFPTRPNL
ncbi:MAG: dTDP-4-dehydrorhamnose reductase [Nitrospinae bacterium CG11_big_fil_rev_8_21_14_0_20_45_15]|nr:MAG: dTDP-4-dehydrorhamnose reductase [Nitrospinae bacterium CG11_big_fil_rev_8_21_14_0_20_45_15]